MPDGSSPRRRGRRGPEDRRPSPDATADLPAGRAVGLLMALLALVASVAVFLAVTKGPVYRMRLERGPLAGDFLDDAWTQSAFCLVYVGALAAVWWPVVQRRADVGSLVRIVPALFAPAMVLVAVASWSPHPARALQQSLMMLLGTAAAVAVGFAAGRLVLLWAVWTAAVTGLLASIIASWLGESYTRDRFGGFVGMYFNKNSFGAVAVLAVLTSLALLAVAFDPSTTWRRRARLSAAGFGLIVGGGATVEAASLTPLVALVAAIAVAAVAVATRSPGERSTNDAAVAGPRRRASLVLWGVVVAVSLLALAIGVHRAGRISTVSDRFEIWDTVVAFIRQRPLLGWGLMAAWLENDMSAQIQLHGGRVVKESHNGFLEVTLGGGIVALLAVLLAVTVAIRATWREYRRMPSAASLWLLAGVVYGIVVNLGETYIGANLLPWMLIAATTAASVAVVDSAGRQLVAGQAPKRSQSSDTASTTSSTSASDSLGLSGSETIRANSAVATG